MSRFRRLLWWLHGRYAHKSRIYDVTGDNGIVYISIVPHFEVALSLDEAEAMAQGLRYQAKVAAGLKPPRRVDYREDR